MPVQWYEDWEPAAKQSKQRKAVSRAFEHIGYSKERREPSVYNVEIVKPQHGDPYMIYAKTGLKVHGVRVSAAMCDKVQKWKSY